MRKIQVWAEVSDQSFLAYEGEARRQGVTVESLVEQMVNELLRELYRAEREGTDHPIVPA